MTREEAPREPARLVVISGGTSNPSTTRMLADRTAQATLDKLREAGREATVSVIDLAPMAVDIARSLVSGTPTESVEAAIQTIAGADGLVVSTPVYKAGVSGLVKSFVDLLDNDLVVAKPVLLAATAGTQRHAMVVDDQLRPLFAFLRALPEPPSLFADPDDWSNPALTKRIKRAATELALLGNGGIADKISDAAWDGYQHQFAGNATRAEQGVGDVNFDTDLMRLATGRR